MAIVAEIIPEVLPEIEALIPEVETVGSNVFNTFMNSGIVQRAGDMMSGFFYGKMANSSDPAPVVLPVVGGAASSPIYYIMMLLIIILVIYIGQILYKRYKTRETYYPRPIIIQPTKQNDTIKKRVRFNL